MPILETSCTLPEVSESIIAEGLVDTGAQLSVIPLRILYRLGLKKKDVIPVSMKAKGANNKNLGLIGGVF